MKIIKEKKESGFTLIELLVVVAIIGMLTSIFAVSFSNSRKKSRDNKRLADMVQMKTGLDIYYSTGIGYPDTAVWNAAQASGSDLICDSVISMRLINDVSPGFSYQYSAGGDSTAGCGGTVWSTFKIRFETEGETDIGPAGTYYMSPVGFTSSPPF